VEHRWQREWTTQMLDFFSTATQAANRMPKTGSDVVLAVRTMQTAPGHKPDLVAGNMSGEEHDDRH
jgi:hypothetical protein